MKNIINLNYFALIFSILILTVSCKKDDVPSSVNVNFDFVWGASAGSFALDSIMKQPRTGDSIRFSEFRFYVSNFKLQNEDGSWWEHPESYFIIDASSKEISRAILSNVPEGRYTKMQYTLGVDSLRNVSGAQVGALSVANNMFWSWATGYILVRVEGVANDTSDIIYHLGGFQGENKIVNSPIHEFGADLEVSKNNISNINMNVNAARLWHTINGVEEVAKIHMVNAYSKIAGTDFYGGVSFREISN
jgi:hypothetical protein